MVSTRSSAKAGPDQTPAAGTKRKDHATSPQSKHQAKSAKQTTIEDTIGSGHEQDAREDSEMKEAPPDSEVNDSSNEAQDEAQDEANGDVEESKDESKAETTENGAIEESSQREKKMASNILEKGIIYFFARNRVGIEDADSVGDLKRTYFVLRPLPDGAKLGDGAIPVQNNNRLFALPKKTFPKSHRDRFMAFVEKSNSSMQDLKDNFFSGAEYETKTAGTRQEQPVTTVGEGVYAITHTEDRSTHLAYALTIPTELGEVQEDLGLRSQGSFIISVKNPERKGPANARLPQPPDFPKEIIEEFRGLAWTEVKPKYLDYPNAQILLIGENTKKAVQSTAKEDKAGKEAPKEQLEQLEHEDELRVEHLHGDDTVFDDLNLSKKDYPKVPTTW